MRRIAMAWGAVVAILTSFSGFAAAQAESAAPAIATSEESASLNAAPAGPTLTPEQAAAAKAREEAAKQAYVEASKAASTGELEEALVLYQKADQLVPAPAPKFKVAITLDKLERFAEAQAAYEAFLEIKPDPDKFFSKIESARDRLRAFLAMPATIKVSTKPVAPPNLVIAVDRMPQPGGEIIVLPGTHTLTAVADGYAGSKTVIVRAAAKMDVEIDLIAQAPAVTAAPPPSAMVRPLTPVVTPVYPPPRHDLRTAAYVAFGLAGVQAIVGGIFVIQALSERDTYDRSPTLENKYAIDRSTAFADAFLATALTSAVGGVVLLLLDPPDAPKSRAPQASGNQR